MKVKLKKKILVVRRPSVEPIPVQSEEEVIKGLMQAQMLRRKHYTEQQRIFGAMTDLQYRMFSRRLEQLIAIEDAGQKHCECHKCGGKCPGKFSGSSSQLMCYDCAFGHHRGLSVNRESPTKEIRHASKSATVIPRKTILKVKRHHR